MVNIDIYRLMIFRQRKCKTMYFFFAKQSKQLRLIELISQSYFLFFCIFFYLFFFYCFCSFLLSFVSMQHQPELPYMICSTAAVFRIKCSLLIAFFVYQGAGERRQHYNITTPTINQLIIVIDMCMRKQRTFRVPNQLCEILFHLKVHKNCKCSDSTYTHPSIIKELL